MCGPALCNEISDRAYAVTPPWVYLWCPRYTPTCMDPWLHPCKERPQPMVHLLRHAAPARQTERWLLDRPHRTEPLRASPRALSPPGIPEYRRNNHGFQTLIRTTQVLAGPAGERN